MPIVSSPLEFRACGRRFEWRQDLLGQLVVRRCTSPCVLTVQPTLTLYPVA